MATISPPSRGWVGVDVEAMKYFCKRLMYIKENAVTNVREIASLAVTSNFNITVLFTFLKKQVLSVHPKNLSELIL